MALGLGRTAGWWQSPAGVKSWTKLPRASLEPMQWGRAPRRWCAPRPAARGRETSCVCETPWAGPEPQGAQGQGRGAARMPHGPSASSAPQACNCDQYLRVSKDVMKQLVRLSVHPGGPGGAGEWGSLGSVGSGPTAGCSRGQPTRAARAVPASRGASAQGQEEGWDLRPSGPLWPWPLLSPQWALLSHPAPRVECTGRHTHMHLASKDTCSAAHACSHACLCTLSDVHTRVHLLALASQALPSSNLNVGEPGCPGRRVSPGRPDQGPSLSFPAWRVGRNGRRASWDHRGGA